MPSGRARASVLPMRKRASKTVSMGSSARSSTREVAIGTSYSSHVLDQMGPRRSGLEGITKVLGLASNLAIQELHDAHRVGRLAIVGEDELCYPEIVSAGDAA